MDKLILLLCTLWYKLMRKHYRLKIRRAQRVIRHAKIYLEDDFLTRHSNIDRGYLLPEQTDALGTLLRTDKHCDYLVEKYFS
jgi:hypothetical protein